LIESPRGLLNLEGIATALPPIRGRWRERGVGSGARRGSGQDHQRLPRRAVGAGDHGFPGANVPREFVFILADGAGSGSVSPTNSGQNPVAVLVAVRYRIRPYFIVLDRPYQYSTPRPTQLFVAWALAASINGSPGKTRTCNLAVNSRSLHLLTSVESMGCRAVKSRWKFRWQFVSCFGGTGISLQVGTLHPLLVPGPNRAGAPLPAYFALWAQCFIPG
jgi:hypothetical protein